MPFVGTNGRYLSRHDKLPWMYYWINLPSVAQKHNNLMVFNILLSEVAPRPDPNRTHPESDSTQPNQIQTQPNPSLTGSESDRTQPNPSGTRPDQTYDNF